jgi:hypothetical protein
MRLQLGEALVTGGVIVLVVTPLVYRAHTASQHVVARRSLLWPTAWMIVPLVVALIGAGMVLASTNLFAPRRKSKNGVGPAR